MMGGAVRRVFCAVLAGGRQRHQFLSEGGETRQEAKQEGGKEKGGKPARSGIYEAPSQTQ